MRCRSCKGTSQPSWWHWLLQQQHRLLRANRRHHNTRHTPDLLWRACCLRSKAELWLSCSTRSPTLRPAQVLAGAVVASGELDAVVVSTGKNTFFGKTMALLAQPQERGHLNIVLGAAGHGIVWGVKHAKVAHQQVTPTAPAAVGTCREAFRGADQSPSRAPD